MTAATTETLIGHYRLREHAEREARSLQADAPEGTEIVLRVNDDASWSLFEVKPAPLNFCPTCEGSGQVPSASGLTDVPCLCTTLDGIDRVILRGRADTLAAWERGGATVEECARLRSSMVHLVAGCSGVCRGNVGPDRCVL